jgi:hypothetical protein
MADPRNIIAFEGIDEVFTTFLTDAVTIVFDQTLAGGTAAATLNKAVSMSTDKTIQLASDGEGVVGKLFIVGSDNKATVQIEGCTSLPGGVSATLTVMTGIVGALGAASAKGFIRSAASGTAAELLKQNGKIWDASDPTAVVINF